VILLDNRIEILATVSVEVIVRGTRSCCVMATRHQFNNSLAPHIAVERRSFASLMVLVYGKDFPHWPNG
jgi:hypothetical protein